MKKFTALVVSLLMVGALFAQVKALDKDNGYFIYFKGSNTKITEEEYLNYAKVVEAETYRKYKKYFLVRTPSQEILTGCFFILQ